MNIQKIQGYQQNFGTKVTLEPFAAKQLDLAGAGKKVLRHIKLLENNGVKDSVVISYAPIYSVHISVFEQRDGKSFMSPIKTGAIKTIQKNGKAKFVDIMNLYNAARAEMNEVVIHRKGFDKFIPYLGD